MRKKLAPMFLSPCDWLVAIYKLMIGQLHAITAERKLAGSTIFRENANYKVNDSNVMFTKCFQKVDRAWNNRTDSSVTTVTNNVESSFLETPWMTQDNASGKAAKKARYQSSDLDKDVINAASDAEEWTHTCPSSEDETLGEAINNEGMEGTVNSYNTL